MAHMKKYKKISTGAMTNHYDRTQEGTQERDNIDPSRSGDNYVIFADNMTKGKDLEALTHRVRGCINKAIEEHKETTGRSPRSDAVLFGDWIVTLPKDCEQPDEFFECVVEFMKLRYGSENVLGGYVHNDETTPHMHIPVIPVVDGRLKGKAMLSRKDLLSFHHDLQEYMDDHDIQASVLLDDDAVADKLLSSIPQDKLDVFKAAIENEIEEQVDERTEKLEKSIEIREKNLEFKYKRKNDDLTIEHEQRKLELDKREKDLLNRENEAKKAMSELESNKQLLIQKERALIRREEIVENRDAEYLRMVSKNTVYGKYSTAIVLSVLRGVPNFKKAYEIIEKNGVMNVNLDRVLEAVEKANTAKNRTLPRGDLNFIKTEYEKQDDGPDF